jgi:monoamine oxidase
VQGSNSQDAWAHSPFRWVLPGGLDSLGDAVEFEPDAAYAHPARVEAFDGRRRKRVCIIGGGIGGLAAAYELAQIEHEVVLLEASNRFGGRILTHYFADGTYGELGAMRIPADHGCVWHYLRDFGLATRQFVADNPNGWCLFRDAPKMRRQDWDRNWTNWYGATGGRSARGIIEDLGRAEPISGREWWESLSNRLTSAKLRRLDNTTLGQHALGIPNRLRRQLSDEEWEFAGRTAHHAWLEPTALLHWLREGGILDTTAKFEIVGGMDLLTRAFVTRIRDLQPDALALGARVLSVELADDGVAVTWRQTRDEALCTDRFDYVICTAPAPATKQLRFRPNLPPAKREALSTLSHVSAGKTIMRCSKRHWELFDDIYGGTSVTDRPNQQCWYPSDNHRPPAEDDNDHLIAELEIDFTRDLLDVRAGIVDRVAETRERSEQPAVFLAAYLWATNARRFASLSDAERDDLICRSVAELHEHNDRYLEDVVHIAWDEQSTPGGGAFAFFAPGEQRRYQEALCVPLPADGPKVFFAGEHVGIFHGWIQSSIQTALAAAIDVASAP